METRKAHLLLGFLVSTVTFLGFCSPWSCSYSCSGSCSCWLLLALVLQRCSCSGSCSCLAVAPALAAEPPYPLRALAVPVLVPFFEGEGCSCGACAAALGRHPRGRRQAGDPGRDRALGNTKIQYTCFASRFVPLLGKARKDGSAERERERQRSSPSYPCE